MKIAVLDFDHSHNQRIQAAVPADDKTKWVVCQQVSELLEILNPNQVLETNLKRMEKSVLDGQAMMQKTVDGLNKAQASLKEPGQTPQTTEILKKQVAAAEELKKKIEMALAARQKEIEGLKTQTISEAEKKIDLILVDRSFLGNLPSDWLVELRQKIDFAGNKEVPVITMGYNEELNYIKNTLHGGIADYFVKPVDLLLLKFTLAKLGAGDSGNSKVFELETKTDVKLLKIATVRKMSEFELNVKLDSAIPKDEIVEFYTEAFGGEKGGRVLGKCIKCEADSTEKGWFNALFALVGHTPHTMTEMRKWIRAQYLAAKAVSEKG